MIRHALAKSCCRAASISQLGGGGGGGAELKNGILLSQGGCRSCSLRVDSFDVCLCCCDDRPLVYTMAKGCLRG